MSGQRHASWIRGGGLAVTAACLIAWPVAGAGCATIANGTRSRIQLESHPEQARIFINGQYTGTTPLATVLSRRQPHRVELEYGDGQRYEILFERKISGWFFANLALGLATGGIGMIVDAMAGAMWTLTPVERTPWGRLLLYEGSDRLFLRVYRCVYPQTGRTGGPGPDGRCAGHAPARHPLPPPSALPEETPPEPPPLPPPTTPPPPGAGGG